MIYKRATAQLEKAGVQNIQIVKRLYGASPENIMFDRQQSQCFKTPSEAVQAVLAGFRPTQTRND